MSDDVEVDRTTLQAQLFNALAERREALERWQNEAEAKEGYARELKRLQLELQELRLANTGFAHELGEVLEEADAARVPHAMECDGGGQRVLSLAERVRWLRERAAHLGALVDRLESEALEARSQAAEARLRAANAETAAAKVVLVRLVRN